MPAPEPVETADTKPAAKELAAEWDRRLASLGAEKTHRTAVRFIRLARLVACWGVFVEPRPVPVPLACPCGIPHQMTSQVREAYENITRGLPATVTVAVNGRAWLVPRIYIAAHGLNAGDLPALASQYGFTTAAS